MNEKWENNDTPWPPFGAGHRESLEAEDEYCEDRTQDRGVGHHCHFLRVPFLHASLCPPVGVRRSPSRHPSHFNFRSLSADPHFLLCLQLLGWSSSFYHLGNQTLSENRSSWKQDRGASNQSIDPKKCSAFLESCSNVLQKTGKGCGSKRRRGRIRGVWSNFLQ